MMLQILDQENSIFNNYLAEIRDSSIQKDSARFRTNLTRCGEIIAYELSKSLKYKDAIVNTPLGAKHQSVLDEEIILVCILRASLPLYQGFLNIFKDAESGFIGAYRVEGSAEVSINLDYMAFPDINEKTLIVIDPMLATGKSLVNSIDKLNQLGKPGKVIIASLICSEEGISHVNEVLGEDIPLYAGSVDKELNEQFYIVPGLGDAGDLSFGEKI